MAAKKKRRLRDQNLETLRKLKSNKVQSRKHYKRISREFREEIRQIIEEDLEILKEI